MERPAQEAPGASFPLGGGWVVNYPAGRPPRSLHGIGPELLGKADPLLGNRFMRRLSTVVLGLLLVAPLLFAEDKKEEKKAETKDKAASFKDLQKEFFGKMRSVKSIEERTDLFKTYSPKFLAVGEKESGTEEGLAALSYVLQMDQAEAGKAASLLAKDYAGKPQMAQFVNILKDRSDEGSIELLKAIVEKQTDKKVQAKACLALVGVCEKAAARAKEIRDNEEARKKAEAAQGKEAVEKLLKNADRVAKDGKEYAKVYAEKFKDVVPDLGIGKPAPEVVSQDLNGKKVKLSELRGKVVVLDIWATWCPPCRAMIPHERELVKKLKDKPFVLVSISADAKKETLTDFMEKTPMPWTHWWNGAEGGILADWDVEFFPTIYVLDSKGIIRAKGVRGEEMDKAVEKLLKEMEEKKEDKKE
jgi:thiol-disulfide isomerase/thioredoxin